MPMTIEPFSKRSPVTRSPWRLMSLLSRVVTRTDRASCFEVRRAERSAKASSAWPVRTFHVQGRPGKRLIALAATSLVAVKAKLASLVACGEP